MQCIAHSTLILFIEFPAESAVYIRGKKHYKQSTTDLQWQFAQKYNNNDDPQMDCDFVSVCLFVCVCVSVMQNAV